MVYILFFLFYFIFKIYIIVLVLPNIKMNHNILMNKQLFKTDMFDQ